jgi:hypothetical protein
MKKFSVLFVICLFCLTVFGQRPVNTVNEIYLAKDDGSGKAGDPATAFVTTDIPIFCVVKLNLSLPTTVKMNLVAVEVKGLKAETTVITTIYTTKEEQNRVNFKGKPEKLWFAGKYRVDVFLNDKLAITQEFEIQKPTVSEANSVQTKSKPKPVRKFRRY